MRGQTVEVINFGVSGYGTAQELLTLREKVWKYSPDLVLLAITTNNDITDNSRALKRTDDVPYFVFQDNKLTLDDSFKQTRAFAWRKSLLGRLGNWLKIHSRVVQAATQGQRGLRIQIASWRLKRAGEIERTLPAVRLRRQGQALPLRQRRTKLIFLRDPKNSAPTT